MPAQASRTLAGIAILLGSATIGTVALASTLPFQAPVVPNPVLAKMVGKGVIGGQIVYFGVQMQTNWTAPGSQTPLQGNLDISFNSGNQIFVPTITYSVSNGQLPDAVSNPNTQVSSGGLHNIDGVTQAIQIGGQDNAIQNSMTLNVIKGVPTLPAGGKLTGRDMTTHAGDVTLTVQPGQLSMLVRNGANTVQQGIGSSGAFQIDQIASNANQIKNSMQMTLGINPGRNSSNAQLQGLQSLLGNNLLTSSIP